MADVPTERDLFLAGRQEAILSPTRFDKAIIDTVGSDINIVFRVASAMGEEVARFLQVAINELSLSTANGEALDRWVFDRYQITRKEASAAVVTLTLSRTNTTPGFTIPAGSSFGTATGVNFTTATDVAFADGQIGPLSVLATAEQTGTAGNVEAATVTQVISALVDSSVIVTNAEAATGGNEQETDDELRSRARDFFTNARRGTRTAIEFGALEVARVSQATAAETFEETTGLPGYRVTLNISDSDGQANEALAGEVEESLDEYRALGVPVLVVPAVPQYVQISATGLLFEAGANTASVLDEAANRVLALVNGIAPGDTLRRADVLSTLSGTTQLIVPDGALTEPAGDLVPSTGTVIRTTRDRISLTG